MASNVKKLRAEALRKASKAAERAFKREISKSSWNASPKRLMDSIEVEVTREGIQISSDHPAFQYLNAGVRAHSMDYLTKADKPIPIITKSGEVIYRTATEKSLREGSWRHPGIEGKHFLERGREAAAKAVRKEITASLSEAFGKALKGK